jgi:hypothetical protein
MSKNGKNLPVVKVENLPLNYFFNRGVRSDIPFGQAKRQFLIAIFEYVLMEFKLGKTQGQIMRNLKKDGLPLERAQQICTIAASEPEGCRKLIENLQSQLRTFSAEAYEQYRKDDADREFNESLGHVGNFGADILQALIFKAFGG